MADSLWVLHTVVGPVRLHLSASHSFRRNDVEGLSLSNLAVLGRTRCLLLDHSGQSDRTDECPLLRGNADVARACCLVA